MSQEAGAAADMAGAAGGAEQGQAAAGADAASSQAQAQSQGQGQEQSQGTGKTLLTQQDEGTAGANGQQQQARKTNSWALAMTGVQLVADALSTVPGDDEEENH